MTSQSNPHIRKLAEKSGMPHSEKFVRILERAMTDAEAAFMLALPAPFEEVAAKFNMDVKAVEKKVLGLAQRGLLSRNPDKLAPEKFQFTNIPAILHDNILSSNSQYIAEDMPKLWMNLYRGDQWWKEIGGFYEFFQEPILRVVPAEKSLPLGQSLMSCESITKIIEANRDLISIRNCCCRVGADNCHHPRDVCMQFKGRAEFDLYRGSGRKVSPDEAFSIALTSVGAGLVPTATNISLTDNLEFICFCCACACMVLDPGLRTGSLPKILAPSRFEAEINVEACNGCRYCVSRCQFGAIDMKPVPGHDVIKAVLDPEKCYGCGVCELSCIPGAIKMVEDRPRDFIPQGVKDEEILHF
ncbi:MAG: 4Fe-4S dicluster domain-containing protein [Chloroflexi bacterium]|nr:4Fe-4S dicluster domain-containing protein [Chloroflexota bacterium]